MRDEDRIVPGLVQRTIGLIAQTHLGHGLAVPGLVVLKRKFFFFNELIIGGGRAGQQKRNLNSMTHQYPPSCHGIEHGISPDVQSKGARPRLKRADKGRCLARGGAG